MPVSAESLKVCTGLWSGSVSREGTRDGPGYYPSIYPRKKLIQDAGRYFSANTFVVVEACRLMVSRRLFYRTSLNVYSVARWAHSTEYLPLFIGFLLDFFCHNHRFGF